MKIIFFTTFALTKLLIGEQLGLKKVSNKEFITQPPSDSIDENQFFSKFVNLDNYYIENNFFTTFALTKLLIGEQIS